MHVILVPSTGWRRLRGCLKLQVIFRKRATNYRALLRKMTYEDKASYDSTPPSILHSLHSLLELHRCIGCPNQPTILLHLCIYGCLTSYIYYFIYSTVTFGTSYVASWHPTFLTSTTWATLVCRASESATYSPASRHIWLCDTLYLPLHMYSAVTPYIRYFIYGILTPYIPYIHCLSYIGV